VALLALSCAALAQTPCDKNSFCVGAAKTEITAPPGFPTGGQGPAGNVARGSWSRNWARAFVFKDSNGVTVALVSCDTFAIPLQLTSHVWGNVKGKPGLEGLKAEGLLIVATHTHQGAGNYMDASAYNTFGSVLPGFSRPLFDFLVTQVSAAITTAVGQMHASTARLYRDEVNLGYNEPFLVNRSPISFAENWDAASTLHDLGDYGPDAKPCPEKHVSGEPEDGWDLEGCPRLRAIDRHITILEVSDRDSKTKIADLVFFACHPTVLTHSAPLFNSDFTGYAMDALEGEAPGLIAGFFNGAEGDITARRFYRDVLEVVDRGRAFLGAVKAVLNGSPVATLDPTTTVRGRMINTQSAQDRPCTVGSITYALAPIPQPGVAEVGGAELDRTSFYDLGWKSDVRSLKASGGQGSKQPALDMQSLPGVGILTTAFSGPLAFPSELPVIFIKLGTFSLGTVPLEMSTTAGYRIRKDMEMGHGLFALIGLADAYASYSATASEYAAQEYMGASTLWGPSEADFFRCQLAHLRDADTQPAFKFPVTVPALGDPFGPEKVGEARDLPDEDLDEILRDSGHVPMRQLPFFEWSEIVSGAEKYTAASKRFVSVKDTAGNVIDATDVGFIKILKRAPVGDCQTWDAIWLGPLLGEEPAINYVFNIRTARGDMITSIPFTVNLASSTKPAPVAPAAGQASCNTNIGLRHQ